MQVRATHLLDAQSFLYDFEPTSDCSQNICWAWNNDLETLGDSEWR